MNILHLREHHVMSTFKKGVVSVMDGKENSLTKLEFTTSVFEEINLKQQGASFGHRWNKRRI